MSLLIWQQQTLTASSQITTQHVWFPIKAWFGDFSCDGCRSVSGQSIPPSCSNPNAPASVSGLILFTSAEHWLSTGQTGLLLSVCLCLVGWQKLSTNARLHNDTALKLYVNSEKISVLCNLSSCCKVWLNRN